MKLRIQSMFVFFIAGAIGSAAPALAAASTDVAPVEVFYIPQEDLARGPGYASEGLYLPLSELLELAAHAQGASEKRETLSGVCCRSLNLSGTLKEGLALEGELSFVAAGDGWSAVLVDDGGIPWLSQASPETAPAFLSRVRGKTFLFARGPSEGVVRLKAFVPARGDGVVLQASLGRIFAPCRVTLDHDESIAFDTASAPADASPAQLRLWPAQGAPVELRYRMKAGFQAPAALRVEHAREIKAAGGGLQLEDELTLAGRFSPGEPIQFALPEQMRLLRATTSDAAEVRIDDAALTVVPLQHCETLKIWASLAVDAVEGRAVLKPWKFDAQAVYSSVRLIASPQYAPVPVDWPEELFPAAGGAADRHYECWGALPELSVALADASPPQPLRVSALLTLAENAATVEYYVELTDPHQREIRFQLPVDWVLTELTATRGKQIAPVAVQQEDDRWWRVTGAPSQNPGAVRFSLRRMEQWGRADEATTLELPLARFVGLRPSLYELRIAWPEGLEARVAQLSSMVVTPVGGSFVLPSPGDREAQLALQAEGDAPSGSLAVRMREAEQRVTVVTVLSVQEDRANIRALLSYETRFAPSRAFRFSLPAGTGSNVRIEGEGIRETSLQETAEGDVWTVIAQRDVLGEFQLTLEWSLDAKPGAKAIQAPEIRLPDIAMQQGFIVLEGSQTLLLNTESKNLAETELSELPPLPWPRENRLLAVYRYIEPPFLLSVQAEKLEPEPALEGLADKAELVTTVAANGERLTRARYDVKPTNDRQFLPVTLPAGAVLWSALVNGEGIKPARQTIGAETVLLAPLPARGESSAGSDKKNVQLELLYLEQGKPLWGWDRLKLTGPELPIPINRTVWKLNLPPGFEYMTFGGSLTDTIPTHPPIITFLRTSDYPPRLVFLNASTFAIIFLTFVTVMLGMTVYFGVKQQREKREAQALSGESRVKEAPKKNTVSRLVELLVVLLIIAILAAIAVPNFLEFQTRAKVSRAKADLRTMATALEAYFVDNRAYPVDPDILWQGSVRYITGPANDPYTYGEYYSSGGEEAQFRYLQGMEAYRAAQRNGAVDLSGVDPNQFWLMYSVGPDQRDDKAQILYDPTNGTESTGDVVRFAQGAAEYDYDRKPRVINRLAGRMDESRQVSVAGKAIPQAPARQLAWDEELAKEPQSISVDGDMPAELNGDSGVSFGPKRERQVANQPASLEELMPAEQYAKYQAGRQAGLLSLGIEIPEGGVQRAFEALGGEARMEANLMSEGFFRRLVFIFWIGAMLAMIAVWRLKRESYRLVFVSASAAALLIPLFVPGPYIVLFNAAFQGILCSLVAPLFTVVVKRMGLNHRQAPLVVLIGACLLAASVPARSAAEEKAEAVRILAPYGEDWSPLSAGDPQAFISREHFTRLWDAAQTDRAAAEAAPPVLAEARLTGALDADAPVIRGELLIRAMNPEDAPTSCALAMEGLVLQRAVATPPGATLEAAGDQLRLQMDAGWSGSITAAFELPCERLGFTGSLRLSLPDLACGEWRVEFPFADMELSGSSAPSCVVDRSGECVAATGAIRAGTLELSWTGMQAERDAAAEAASQPEYQANVFTRLLWPDLSFSRWHASIHLEASDQRDLLPEELRFKLDPGLRIFSVQGNRLLSTVVDENEMIVRLRPSQAATLEVEGFSTAQTVATDGIQQWVVPGLRPADGIRTHTLLKFAIAGGIEILSSKAEGMTRTPVDVPLPGYAAQQYETESADWRVVVDMRRRKAELRADVHELIVAGGGFLRLAASIGLNPQQDAVHQCRLQVPEGLNVQSLSGDSLSDWSQADGEVHLTFDPPLQDKLELVLTALAELDAEEGRFAVQPLSVADARDDSRTMAIIVSPDQKLTELDLAGATPRRSNELDQRLRELMLRDASLTFYAASPLQCYALTGGEPLTFRLEPVPIRMRTAIFNHVTIEDGVQRLEAVIRATPLKGRIQEVAVLLESPEAQAAASRLQTPDGVRQVNFSPAGDGLLKVAMELMSPVQGRPVELRLKLDQAQNTENGDPVVPSVFLPFEPEGARVFLHLSREFEGELSGLERGRAQAADPSEVNWPETGFRVLPSDQAFELSPQPGGAPSFQVVRHERADALRAIVEVMRQRTIITKDGFERSELDIALQNQSSQFLKIGFPYSREQLSIYEIRVAGRAVRAIFDQENGRDVLLVPLIRTGMLDPELNVRIAYTVSDRPEFSGKGKRVQQLPEILDGVPVAQSSLVLMLPPNFKYSSFKGTLNEVELVDLELDEAVRQSKRLEQMTEEALLLKGTMQRRALKKVVAMQSKVESNVQQTQQIVSAQFKQESLQRRNEGKDKERWRDRLQQEREGNLEIMASNAAVSYSNISQLNDFILQQDQQAGQAGAMQAAQEAQAEPEPEAAQPAVEGNIVFPRAGEVFAFRQLQGTGMIQFKFKSLEAREIRNDVLLGAFVVAAIALLTFASRFIFHSFRRVAVIFLVVCVAAVLTGTALDLSIPGAVIALIALMFKGGGLRRHAEDGVAPGR
ncbi:hypothetical protein JXA32_05860 [Candidatus Sumerlaeota bacterium]|nr:hypothetical protein [Candidatus Sumerlaeota bacterium]